MLFSNLVMYFIILTTARREDVVLVSRPKWRSGPAACNPRCVADE
jgi:hypothetical protein